MEKKAKIYVAGHAGLVGSALCRRLASAGYGNVVVRTSAELDLRRQTAVESFFEQERPDYVFLAAARVGGILANSTYTADFIYDNMMIAVNVIHAAKVTGVKKLLNLGSSCIYPRNTQQPMKEEQLLTGSLEPTNEPYAIAKIAAIKLCRYYNQQYGTNFMSVMPANLYGPADNFNLETAHVLPALMRKFHLAKLLRRGAYDDIVSDIRRRPLGYGIDTAAVAGDRHAIGALLARLGVTEDHVEMWGSGEVFREFLYGDDLADACVFLMGNIDTSAAGEFVNIGTGKDIRLTDLADLVKEVTGFEGEIRRDPTKPDGMPKKLLDTSRAAALGWRARTSLIVGITSTYEWYCRTVDHP